MLNDDQVKRAIWLRSQIEHAEFSINNIQEQGDEGDYDSDGLRSLLGAIDTLLHELIKDTP